MAQQIKKLAYLIGSLRFTLIKKHTPTFIGVEACRIKETPQIRNTRSLFKDVFPH